MTRTQLATVVFLTALGIGSAQAQLLDLHQQMQKPREPLDVMGAFRSSRNLISEETLRTWCAAPPENRVNAGFCLAYILGVVDAYHSSLAFQKHTEGVDQAKIEMCFAIPNDVSGNQVRDVVVKQLSTPKSDGDFPASWSVGYALKKAFPCK